MQEVGLIGCTLRTKFSTPSDRGSAGFHSSNRDSRRWLEIGRNFPSPPPQNGGTFVPLPAFAPTPRLNLSPATQFFGVANPPSQLTTKFLPDASLGAFGVAFDWEHDALSRPSLPSFPFGMFSLVVITQVLAGSPMLAAPLIIYSDGRAPSGPIKSLAFKTT